MDIAYPLSLTLTSRVLCSIPVETCGSPMVFSLRPPRRSNLSHMFLHLAVSLLNMFRHHCPTPPLLALEIRLRLVLAPTLPTRASGLTSSVRALAVMHKAMSSASSRSRLIATTTRPLARNQLLGQRSNVFLPVRLTLKATVP